MRTCQFCSRPLPPRHKMLACNQCSDMVQLLRNLVRRRRECRLLAAIQAGWTAADYAKRAGKVETSVAVAESAFDRRRNGLNFV